MKSKSRRCRCRACPMRAKSARQMSRRRSRWHHCRQCRRHRHRATIRRARRVAQRVVARHHNNRHRLARLHAQRLSGVKVVCAVGGAECCRYNAAIRCSQLQQHASNARLAAIARLTTIGIQIEKDSIANLQLTKSIVVSTQLVR